MALIEHVINMVLELGETIFGVTCGHHNSTPTTPNLAPLVLLERAREGAYNDANGVYI
jgi:hypothetical protein